MTANYIVHLCDLGGASWGNLLDTESGKLVLQIGKLLGKFSFGFATELESFYVGRLHDMLVAVKDDDNEDGWTSKEGIGR